MSKWIGYILYALAVPYIGPIAIVGILAVWWMMTDIIARLFS